LQKEVAIGAGRRDVMDDKVKFIQHRGKKILYLDFSQSTAADVLKTIVTAKSVIAGQPEQSLLTLTNVTDARFNDAVSHELKNFTAHNRPFVRAGAVIGVSGFKKIIFDAVVLFSGRKLSAFDDVEQAKQWLVEQ
jgi:hypothetical protein